MIVLQCESTSLKLSDVSFPVEIFDMLTAYRYTMAGKIRSYRKRPARMIWEIKVRILSYAVFTALRTFIRSYQGKQIFYTDYEGVRHKAVILNDPVEVEELDRNQRGFTLKLEEIRNV